MIEARPNLSAVRDAMVVIFLALLVGCKGVDETVNPATAVPTDTMSPGIPLTPANLAATAGNAQASLTWSASTNATSYNIKRATTSGGPYTQLAADTSPSYTDSAVTNGVTYFYVVTAVDSAGESADSTAVSATPDAAITTPPVPTGLTATAGNAQASLTWSASSGATGYHVKRATASGGPYTQVAAPTATSYTDTALTNGTTYYYVVSALDSAGESANSAQVSAKPVASAITPATPANLSATAGDARATLTWSASTGATSYNVKRATTSGGPYTQVGAPTTTSYTDTLLTNSATYYYVVSAVDSAGESANSAQVSAKPVASTVIPAAPAGLAATAGNAQASLTWSASSGATSYHVKRATTSGGPYTQVGAPTSTSYTDTSLTNGTTYYYVVTAVDSAGESVTSSQASATPAAPVTPPPPTTFGTWINVTPTGVDLVDALTCGNFGVETVQTDPAHPADLYALFHCQGIWKSTDYGATWTGPINTGTNGAATRDCAGGITIAPASTASVPTIYESCIRGSGLGFWKSVDGGVNWTTYFVAPSGTSRQDYYPPVVDPYDPNHLVMAAHEMDYLVESVDGGQHWTNVPLAGGMLENGGTGEVFFINTGNAATTRGTWLWLAQASGGIYGTWRTENNGAAWTQVDKNEHPHGASQIYQPDNNGTVYMAGTYSVYGWGVLRSADYGQTWAHVGPVGTETVVVGTPKNVYAMYGWSIGLGLTLNPGFQLAAQPGTGTWA
ncbi:MAG TPA: fibronectin type III domain-containing protein, partial [Steroidobacteraceae bacterium]|nr:fibronectin type III domain-containing protein [Steroidobacteraceae bacterium]